MRATLILNRARGAKLLDGMVHNGSMTVGPDKHDLDLARRFFRY